MQQPSLGHGKRSLIEHLSKLGYALVELRFFECTLLKFQNLLSAAFHPTTWRLWAWVIPLSEVRTYLTPKHKVFFDLGSSAPHLGLCRRGKFLLSE
jgi:hypothetical protein